MEEIQEEGFFQKEAYRKLIALQKIIRWKTSLRSIVLLTGIQLVLQAYIVTRKMWQNPEA